jgi:hypothetical protein
LFVVDQHTAQYAHAIAPYECALPRYNKPATRAIKLDSQIIYAIL